MTPFDWAPRFRGRHTSAPLATAHPVASPAATDPDVDQLRTAVFRHSREDAGTDPMAPVPAATTVPPMPTWTPGSRFGMCREPWETTR